MTDVGPLRPGDPERLGMYRLTGRLGEGGQGSVFLGESAAGERVAVKILHTWLLGDARARARFAREIDHAKRIMPFCTARVLDADAEGDLPYIVSEFIDGPSLNEVLRRDGRRTGVALDRLAIGTITALTAIHEAGIVHRDFKPGNVIIAPDGPRVIDFGIARALNTTGTLTNASLGTPSYMSPEQFSGNDVGPPTDVFAWGCTMAFAANGRPPHGDDSIPAIMNRVVNQPPDLGELSGPLRDIVAQCLAKDPLVRPTARQILLRLLGGADVPAAPVAAAGQNLLTQGVQAATPATPPAPAAPLYATTPPPFPQPPVPPPPYPAPQQTPAASYGQQPYSQPYTVPTPQRRTPNVGLIVAGGGGAALLLVLVVVVVVLANGRDNPPTPTNSPTSTYSSPPTTPVSRSHDVVAAQTAGGWRRDAAGESHFASTIDSQKTTLRNSTGNRLTKVVSGFYKDPNGSSSASQPAGVIFLGGTGPIGDPDLFVSSFKGAASQSGKVTEVDPGAGGGRGVCAQVGSGTVAVAFCAWATNDSFGEIVSTAPGRSSSEVAQLMRTMRPDLEYAT
ncbi:MAG TPA: serine/threonine-protein kinase [Streptosporangiaceae bacterium]|jgi:serine/threonine protein kinase